MAESSEEKTEEATPKRIREARKKGQVAKSKDLTTVIEMIVVFVIIAITIDFMGEELEKLMKSCFEALNDDELDGALMWGLGVQALIVMAKILLPVFLGGMAAAIIVGFLQVGPIFTTEPLTPKFEKLNPIEGLKNMFKLVTFIELIKNIAKLALVFYLAYSTINKYTLDIFNASKVNIKDAVWLTGDLLYSFFIKVCLCFLLIALIDFYVQRWNFMKNMRMSKEEVKREYKQDEGDPQIKGERRRLHREMVFGDVKQNVKKSDAVVSNPTHVAVAVKYDRGEMAAPEVVIKGRDQFAEMILKAAQEENIPVIRNVPLAWSLLKVEEGDAIPEELYEPVAEVLCLVYEMKENQEKKKQEPSPKIARKDSPGGFNPFS